MTARRRGVGPYPAVEATKKRLAAARKGTGVGKRANIPSTATGSAAVAKLRAEVKANTAAIVAAFHEARQPWIPANTYDTRDTSGEPAEWFT